MIKPERAAIPFDQKIADEFIGPADGKGGFIEWMGFELVEAGPGSMHGRMVIRDDFMTPIGNMHGGVLSAFCDHMLGTVCYSAMKPGQWAATAEFKINLTAPVVGGVVDAYAEIVNLSRTMAVVRIDLHNNDRVCAVVQGTVMIRDPKPKA